ncbi:AAA family ATPase [Macrococcoides caseolyticum]|uniref:ATP-dependent Clp protease ATP-binding subunit n=1 Tax=Macrococcoides caseolyticum TaxID=69966 RepID=A0ACC9MVT9_9STAP|nr:ATP-dependent Clp protease ATP-binding subunit [Macrococcus caseolyticus]ARQ04237.1 ATP-dependent Clp protease ATP-binding subunit ClpL [Macrococcus caseolyticus]PKE00104.1 ATP-dependent Clp protease ATP-binding subunit [Macrococcus caseolyticus]PKE40680.1 ATP-dependent Clp protease ATP-binding subunit [Macrococcus caseolyticus]PKE57660.1 ATP-dependent Clp protease ATP-binding subunit [Macrococcus caseolyticus]PKF20186.1 ATP-dependent Clp protease ATP-binding subunit [Macrococcus caseolytic
MNNDIFGNNFDAIFNRMFNEMNNGQISRKFYINGQEVSSEAIQQHQQQQQQQHQPHTSQQTSDSFLNKIGRNLTEEARNNQLDPVIGRESEVRQAAEVLSRRIKNNPILVGEAGVGKTAVVEGLAQAIVKGDVPASIKDKEIISIDVSALEAGTQYRGAFEENVQKLLEEVKAQGNVVLFIDEIHQIIGSGSTGGDSGSKGLSDILKPALSRGEISIIGATTQDEYRNNIMKDPALARRFNEVVVNEPSKADTIKILKGIKENYENHHHVKIDDEVIETIVDLSIQYMPGRMLPDKAIDLMDITAAHVSARNTVVDKVEIEKEIEALEAEKLQVVEQEDFNRAQELQMKIKALKDKLSAGVESNHVTKEDVSATVERMTGVPVSQMDDNEIERLKHMQSRLASKVIGQDEAVQAVAKAIRRNRAGFDDGNRPIGSFLFVGPTGVGKTELAKQLSLELFGTTESMIRLDMSEYMDQTAVSKMIGTTAGYVGYDDNSNTLTEQVRRNPYSVILLDEIEKAHPQVLTLLLQVLDDGALTDGQGNTVNFKNTIIIATSNASFGEDHERTSIYEELKGYFRPEFLNRFNAIVEFKHLAKEDLKQIVELLLHDVQEVVARKSIDMEVTERAKDWLVEHGYDQALGARPLRRLIESEVRDSITDYYLDHIDVKHVTIDLNEAEDGLMVKE